MERFCGFCKGFAPSKADFLLIPMQKEQRWSFYLSNLEKFQQVSAVFAVSDYYAIDLMRFLIEQDFSVPEYLMLVSGTFVPMGVRGAAFATVISQCANFLLMVLMLSQNGSLLKFKEGELTVTTRMNWGQYLSMLLPLLMCEVVWSLGENVYAAIYGHMSTDSSAAMTLTNPIQGLVIGALCGLSQAVSVIIGKHLGSGENEEVYWSAKKRMLYSAIGSALLSIIVMITSKSYVEIYQVDNTVKTMTVQILFAYAIVVPLGFLSAFLWKMSIPYVYFLLSLEECIRFGISLIVFHRRKWMNQLEAS